MKNGEAKRRAIAVECHLIADKNRGILRPSDVVKAARNPANVMHDSFEWDNDKAGDLYRLEQAREIIRSVQFTKITDERIYRFPVFVRDPYTEHGTQGYARTLDVATDEDRAKDVLRNELAQIHARIVRARTLSIAMGLDGKFAPLVSMVADLQALVD